LKEKCESLIPHPESLITESRESDNRGIRASGNPPIAKSGTEGLAEAIQDSVDSQIRD
jgi:hypothetical protein